MLAFERRTSVYGFVLILPLLAGWFARFVERRNLAGGLGIAPQDLAAPCGKTGEGLDVPHEQVLLLRAERTGEACLPYLQLELSAAQYDRGRLSEEAADRSRLAVVAMEMVFSGQGPARPGSGNP